MSTVVPTKATVLATPLDRPRASSAGETWGAICAAPKDAEKKPARVTPIWTEERKRLEFEVSRATRAPAPPRSAIARTWLSRSETRAISEAAKTPPRRTKRKTRAMSTTRPFIGPLFQRTPGTQAGRPSGEVPRRCEQGEGDGGDGERRHVERRGPGAEEGEGTTVRAPDDGEHRAQPREDDGGGGHVDEHRGCACQQHPGDDEPEHRRAPAASLVHGSEDTVGG